MKLLQTLIYTASAETGDVIGDMSKVKLDNPLGTGTTVTSLIDRIFDQAIVYVGIIAALVIVFGAFQMMLSRGNPEEFKKGQKTMVYACIGFVIALLAKGIVAIVQEILKV